MVRRPWRWKILMPAVFCAASAISLGSRWLYDTLAAGNSEALLDYRRLAPQAVRNHPSEEHFLPLLVAAGAGLTPQGRRLHTSNSYGSLMMDAYAFD